MQNANVILDSSRLVLGGTCTEIWCSLNYSLSWREEEELGMWVVKIILMLHLHFQNISEFYLTNFSAKNCFDVFMIADIVLGVHRKIFLADEDLW